MSGYSRNSFANFGKSKASAAYSVAVTRIVPEGLSRSSPNATSSASISSKRGPRLRSRRSPASVGDTLRVVRVSSRSLRRSEEHTSELQPPDHLVCRLLLQKKKNAYPRPTHPLQRHSS